MFTLQKMNLPVIFALMSITVLTGCGASHYSIHEVDHLDASESSTVIAVDAKQRLLLTSNVKRTTITTTPANQAPANQAPANQAPANQAPANQAPANQAPATTTTEKTETLRRFCSEPSPDVFSVLSQAASGSLNFGQSADPKTLNIALQGAFSSSEAGSTISRTQTINMLKEMMYRTCERYLNGQISDFESPIIAARDQRIMTSILAIEQLTGTVTPKPATIAVTGSASTGQSTNEAIVRLDDAHKEVAEKEKAFNEKQAAYNEIDNPQGTCKQLEDKKDRTADDDSKLKKCNENQINLKKTEDDLAAAKQHYDTLASLAGKPGASSATTNAISLSPTMDSGPEQAKSIATQEVAKVVKEIVSKSFDQNDETSFFCYSIISKGGDYTGDRRIVESCRGFLMERVELETKKLRIEKMNLK